MMSDYEMGYALSADLGTGGPGPDLFAAVAQDPFVPNDMMDWIVGGLAVAAGYGLAFRFGGFASVARYEAIVPSSVVFAGAVALSNMVQGAAVHRGGRYSTPSSTVTSGFMMV